MKLFFYLINYILLCFYFFTFQASVFAQKPSKEKIVGQIGQIDLAGVALLSVPEGFVFMEGNSIKPPYRVACDSTKYLGSLVKTSSNNTIDSTDFDFVIELIYIQTNYIPDTTIFNTSETLFWNEIIQTNYKKNAYFKKNGCDTTNIESWAMKPYFLQKNHQLQWAVFCRSDNQKYIRYSIQKLGRYGVLEMNISTSEAHLLKINAQIPALTSRIKFHNGFRHEDFDPNFDNLAVFGFAGILAGKALTKVKVVPFIFKWLKWIIIALLGAFTFFKRKLTKRDLENDLKIDYLENDLENEK